VRPFEDARLLAQTKSFDNLAVPIRLTAIQIIKQPSALIDHHNKSAPRSMIFAMGAQMSGQVTDPLAQQCNLHFWRTGITDVNPVLLD
jgi:hypothetical protein